MAERELFRESQKIPLAERIGVVAFATLAGLLGAFLAFLLLTAVGWLMYTYIFGRSMPSGEAAAWGWVPGMGLGIIAGILVFTLIFVRKSQL